MYLKSFKHNQLYLQLINIIINSITGLGKESVSFDGACQLLCYVMVVVTYIPTLGVAVSVIKWLVCQS